MASGKDTLASLVRSRALRWPVRIAAAIFAPRQSVGAVGVLFNGEGQVLLAHHVLRTDFPWGLPGGWVERRENPADAVAREVREELGIEIVVKDLLLSRQVELVERSTHPPHIGLAYYCRLTGGAPSRGAELLEIAWCDPARIPYALAPFQRDAIALGHAAFQRDILNGRPRASSPIP